MKKTLKLVPAFAMLLVSAILVSTSTYAWFTMSNTVTATGMQVKAVTDGSLLIAYGDTEPADSAFLITASAGMTVADELKPASTVDLVNWATTSAAARTAKTAQSDARTNISSNTNGYVLKPNTFWLLSENPTYVYLSGLTVKQGGSNVNVGWNNNNSGHFFNSLRVGIKCGSEWYIYSKTIHTADGTNTSTPATTFVGDAYTSGSDSWNVTTITKAEAISATTGAGTAANHCGIVASNVKTKLEVYIWFEGEDGACYTNNINLDEVEIEFELRATDLAQQQVTGTIANAATVVDGDNYYQVGSTDYYVMSTTAAAGADLYTIDTGHAVKSALKVYGGA